MPVISLTPGGNCTLPDAHELTVTVRTERAHADPIALLVDADGKADGDDGVVLFSHPVSAGGAVRLEDHGISVRPADLPAAVERVLVVGQADGVADLAACGACTTEVAADGVPVATLRLEAPPAFPTVQLVEVYRRQGAWKVRALGDGFEAGLKRLLEVHGVEVLDDEPEPEPVPVAASPPPDLAKPAASGVSFAKLPARGAVSLKKGEGISLVKEDGSGLTKVRMGLGWDPATSGRSVDLDASCVIVDARGKVLDACWFMKLKGRTGAIKHSGDNLTGAGAGDDESISVDLTKVPADAVLIAFTVNSFSGQPLSSIGAAHCRLLDVSRDVRGQALVRYDLREFEGKHRGILMATLQREDGGEWSMIARGESGKGRTYKGMMDVIRACVV